MFKFPTYDKTGTKIQGEYFKIIIDEPIDSTEQLYNYLTNVKLTEETNSFDNIIESINNNKIYKDLFNNSEINNSCKTSTRYNIMKTFNKIPDHYKYNHLKLKDDALNSLNNSFHKSCSWMYQNKEEIIEFLNKKKNNKITEYKNKKSEYNKKYKDKLKNELQIQDKIILTDEQRKINKQIANKIYRDKLKKELQIKDKIILTDEQRKINRQIAQKKYYQKNKSSVALCQAEILDEEIDLA
jgi:hypothetical protein